MLTVAVKNAVDIDLSNIAIKTDTGDSRREMTDMKAELVKWMVGIGFALVATILAALKLFPTAHRWAHGLAFKRCRAPASASISKTIAMQHGIIQSKPSPKPLVIRALLLAFAAVLPLGMALGQNAPGAPIVADLPLAGGTERVLFHRTQGAPALLVLLPGSDGIVGLDPGGGIHQLGSNFLVRTFGQWIAQRFDLVLPDAPNDTSLFGQRHLPAYADAISKAVDFGRSHAALPVWLIGTSAGTTAAVNGAAHLGSKVSGAVLTSPVTRVGRGGETIFDAEPGAVAVPVLVVSNEYDTCAETPPGDAPRVLSALTRSPRKELVMVSSSRIARRADPCEGASPHGYLGIEGMVVQRISEWVRTADGH